MACPVPQVGHNKAELLLFMVALCHRVDHYIFALWLISIFYLLFFIPRLMSAAADWMSTILLHMALP